MRSLGAQQDVELVAGAGVGLDGAGFQVLGGGCGFGLGLLLVGEGGVELVLDVAEADLRLVVLLDHDLELLADLLEVSLGGVDLGLGRRRRRGGDQGAEEKGGDHEDDGYREPCKPLGGPGHAPPSGRRITEKAPIPVAGAEPTRNEANGHLRRRQTSRRDLSPGSKPFPQVTKVGSGLRKMTEDGPHLAPVLRSLESGRRDLNPRPQRPERCALPSCATSRGPQSVASRTPVGQAREPARADG